MKPIFKKLFAVVLVVVLASVLFACSNQKNDADDDSWMSSEIDVNVGSQYARPQKSYDREEEVDSQSGNRVDLPIIPLD